MTKPTWLALSLETLVALLLLVSSYAIMVVNSLVLDGILILITSFAMTSVSAPVGTMVRLHGQDYSARARATFGFVQAVLSILFVLVFSIYYETTGQTNFFTGPLALLVLSLVSSLVLLRVRQRLMTSAKTREKRQRIRFIIILQVRRWFRPPA